MHCRQPNSSATSVARTVVYALAVGSILALAAWLRLSRLGLVTFDTDDGNVLRLAEDWIRLGRVPLVGNHSTAEVPFPPWFIYIVAPAVAISRDPRVATGFVGLLNVAGVAGVVALGWRFFSPVGGLVSGLMLASYPWAVFYSRRLWPNDVLIPCAVLFGWALDRAVIARSRGWAVAALPIFAIGMQVHFSFGVLAPLALAPLAVLVVDRQFRGLAASVGLALLVTMPYLLHQLQTGWFDLMVLRALASKPADVNADGPASVMSWATAWNTWYLSFVHLDRLLPGRVTALAANLQTGLVVLGLGVACVVALGAGRPPLDARLRCTGLLLWLLLPAVLTIRHTVPIGDQYFTVVAPAAALLLGAGVHWLASRSGLLARGLFGLALAGVFVLAAIHVVMVVRLLGYVTVQYNDTYGLPLSTSEAIVDDLVTFAARTNAQSAMVEYGRPENGATAYLLRPFFPVVELNGVAGGVGGDVGDVGLGARLARLPGSDRPSAAMGFLGPVQRPELRYEDGVQVIEAVTSSRWTPGQRIRLAFTWTTPAAVEFRAVDGVRWEVDVYDPSGAHVAEQLGPLHTSATLGPGETVVSLFSIPTESGASAVPLAIGLRRMDASVGPTSREWRSSPIEAEP